VGLILDSSVVIAGERRGHTVRHYHGRTPGSAARLAGRIAATALQLGFGVVTGKIRHFEQIPGLKVVRC
jgi:predicted nucleic acid-binding protein